MMAMRGDAFCFVSPAYDMVKNPLTVSQKMMVLYQCFPDVFFSIIPRFSAINVIKSISEAGYRDITILVGADRIDDFNRMITKYNGKEFEFSSHCVISTGERDGVGIAKYSGTLSRRYAVDGDFDSFKGCCPTTMSEDNIRLIYDIIHNGSVKNGERKQL